MTTNTIYLIDSFYLQTRQRHSFKFEYIDSYFIQISHEELLLLKLKGFDFIFSELSEWYREDIRIKLNASKEDNIRFCNIRDIDYLFNVFTEISSLRNINQ